MTATGKDDPESTPLPAPLPGLGGAGPDHDQIYDQAPAQVAAPAADITPVPAPAVVPTPIPANLPAQQETPAAQAKASAQVPGKAPAQAKAQAPVQAKAPSKAAQVKPAAQAATAAAATKPAATSDTTPQRTPAQRPSVTSPVPTKTEPVAAAGSKRWLIIGGIGALAVAAILVVVLLPKPTEVPPVTPRPTRTTDPGLKPSEPTPVPVVANDPVKPATPTPPTVVGTTAPTKTEPVAVPDPEPDDPDEPEANTTTRPKSQMTEAEKAQRKAAKTARLAAKAAAKAAAKTEAENKVALAPLKTLTAEAQRQNMLKAESRFKACAKEAWGSYVTISIAVDNSGTVQKADLIGPLGQSATGRCIAEQIRKQRFPPFTEGSTKQFVWSYQIPSAP